MSARCWSRRARNAHRDREPSRSVLYLLLFFYPCRVPISFSSVGWVFDFFLVCLCFIYSFFPYSLNASLKFACCLPLLLHIVFFPNQLSFLLLRTFGTSREQRPSQIERHWAWGDWGNEKWNGSLWRCVTLQKLGWSFMKISFASKIYIDKFWKRGKNKCEGDKEKWEEEKRVDSDIGRTGRAEREKRRIKKSISLS